LWPFIRNFAHVFKKYYISTMNNYYSIAYKLYSVKDGEKTFQEEAPASEPLFFISGFGTTIPGFEKAIEPLTKGDTFDFTIPSAEAYGDYVAERVVTLPKPDNERDFDLSIGAVVPLQNADGTRFMGHITAIRDNEVEIDLNHPLAGCDLNFQGSVLECREATNEEITAMINQLSGHGCGGCGGCGGGCEGGGCKDGGCGNCNS